MESPFADKFSKNYVPTDTESSQIRNILANSMNELATVDAELLHLQALIDISLRRRNTLTKSIDDHRALLSPIRRLPNDVLGEIFVACLPTEHNALMSCQEAPLLLGRVCSAWRSLSTSMPRLWRSLHVPIPRKTRIHSAEHAALDAVFQQTMDLRIDAVKMWLGRAGSCPLSVSLADYDPRSEEKMDAQLLDVTVWFSPRFQHLEVSGKAFQILSKHPLLPAEFPALEHIAVVAPEYLVQTEWFDFLAATPALRSVSLSIGTEGDLSLSKLPYEQLTRLSLSGPSITANVAEGVLRRCHNLHSASIVMRTRGLGRRSEIYHAGLGSFTLPFLNRLRVSMSSAASSPSDLTALLHSLRAPNLRHLVLHAHSVSPISVRSFVAQSPLIETLDLSLQSCADEETLLFCLENLPRLVQLRITVLPGRRSFPDLMTENTVAVLTPRDDGLKDCFCPRLEVIHVDGLVATFSDESLFTLIVSRAKYDMPLKRVKVGFLRAKEKDILPQIPSHISASLQLSLAYVPFSPQRQTSFGNLIGCSRAGLLQFLDSPGDKHN